MAKSPGKTHDQNPVMKTTSLKLFFYFFVAFTIAILAFYSSTDKKGAIRRSPVRYIDKWTVTDHSGKVFTTGRYFRDDHHYDGDFS